MNKQTKKKLELQVQSAIVGILTKQDSGAAAKSRKVIKQATKAVVKKFSKAAKSLENKNEKKKTKIKKKTKAGKSQLKNISGETARVRRSYAKEVPVPPAATPAAVTTAEGGSGTENN